MKTFRSLREENWQRLNKYGSTTPLLLYSEDRPKCFKCFSHKGQDR